MTLPISFGAADAASALSQPNGALASSGGDKVPFASALEAAMDKSSEPTAGAEAAAREDAVRNHSADTDSLQRPTDGHRANPDSTDEGSEKGDENSDPSRRAPRAIRELAERLDAIFPVLPDNLAPIAQRLRDSLTELGSGDGLRRDLSALIPEFRARLERLITRMREEFGYTVEVVETTRTAARQDQLFAQGRTSPGPVVTWTRDSKHESGSAADVMINGSYHNPEGFKKLAELARQEGLRTLWPKDPGHIELPGSSLGAPLNAAAARATAPAEQAALEEGMIAVPAPVAAVARVASVAQVATVASVSPRQAAQPSGKANMRAQRELQADPNSTQRGAGVLHPSQVATHATASVERPDVAALIERVTAAMAKEDRNGHTGSHSHHRANPELGVANATLANDGVMPFGLADAALSRGVGEILSGGPEMVARSEVAERIARLLEARDAGPDRPVSSVVLRLEDAAGGEDRIRVDLRGNTVGARLDVRDPMAAERLRVHAPELAHALERHGLEPDSISVRQVRAAEPTWNPATAAERDAVRGAAAAAQSGTTGGRDSGPGGRGSDRGQDTRDADQQKSRRDGRRGAR